MNNMKDLHIQTTGKFLLALFAAIMLLSGAGGDAYAFNTPAGTIVTNTVFMSWEDTYTISDTNEVTVVSNFGGSFIETYTNQTNYPGVTLYFTGDTATNTAVLGYTTTNTSIDGNITYSYTDLRTIV